MARTQAGKALTQLHRQRQLILRAGTLRDMLVLSKLWNSPFDDFADATATLVASRRRDSAGLASEYYRAFRLAEGVPGEPSPQAVTDTNRAQVITSLFVTGLGTYNRGLRAGFTTAKARENALVALSGSVGRHVMNAGRDTLLASTKADKQARGWQRITAGKPCAFCASLASRGPVYKSESSSDFQAHDACACTSEPVYRGGEWTDQARSFRSKWDESTAGLSGNDALNAFRRSFE